MRDPPLRDSTVVLPLKDNCSEGRMFLRVRVASSVTVYQTVQERRVQLFLLDLV